MKVPKIKRTNVELWQDPNATPYIRIENLTKYYGDYLAIDNLSLNIYKEEFFALLGPSGCGKTSLLRILAGLETPTEGKVYIDDVDMTRRPPYDRPVNMMFQSYALFPHMTVEQNVSYGLKQERVPRDEISERVHQVLELVQMSGYKKRKPSQLSGGQKQRVALARSLIKQPKLLLLDEPLGALDKRLREQTQFELVNIQEEVGVTCIMVTHDQEEAMTMSTRLGIMDSGRIRQVGTPSEIYEYPNSEYVADFVGSINKFEGIVTELTPDHLIVDSDEAGCILYVSHSAEAPQGSKVKVAIRPEKVMISTKKPDINQNCTKGKVADIAYLGDMSIYYIRLPSEKVVVASQPNLVRLTERPITWDDDVYVFWRSENSIVMTG